MTKEDLRETRHKRKTIRRETAALDEVLVALTPLDFNETRRILRWVCDYRMIDPTRLSQS